MQGYAIPSGVEGVVYGDDVTELHVRVLEHGGVVQEVVLLLVASTHARDAIWRRGHERTRLGAVGIRPQLIDHIAFCLLENSTTLLAPNK